jgi:hypothetical protein
MVLSPIKKMVGFFSGTKKARLVAMRDDTIIIFFKLRLF